MDVGLEIFEFFADEPEGGDGGPADVELLVDGILG